MILDSVTWQPVDPPAETGDGLPYPTHSGTMTMLGVLLHCHRLNTGEAIIEANDMHRLFGVMGMIL